MIEQLKAHRYLHHRDRARKPFVTLIVMDLVWSLLPLGLTCIEAQAANLPEYAVKAAYLYQFTRFVEWPASALGAPDAPVSFCVLGTDPFGDLLDAIEEKTVKQRRVIVMRLAQIRDAVSCLVLFISASERPRLGQILAVVKDHPVLTVSDIEGFAWSGGIVEFVLQENKIRFAINGEAAARAGTKISSKLLSLAVASGAQQEGSP
jgi:hypothetical protein